MKLTDFETGIEFEFDVSAFGAVFNRGLFREVRTIDHDMQKLKQVYKVRENVPEIIRMAQTEKENKNESSNVISKSSSNCN